MASNNRIKGITVEIGGDVTKLDAALRDANKEISTTQTQLKDVERLLKLDPTNTELLAQKQQLLAEAVHATREKLETLKEAEAQAQEQFQRGEISQEQYMGLQREIIATEQQLSSLEDQARQTADEGLDELGDQAEETGDDLDKAGEKTSTFADKLKNGLVAAAKTAVNAVAGIGAAAVNAIGTLIKKTGEVATAGDDIDKMAQKMGLSTEAYQEWDAIMQHCGTSIDTMQSGMKKLATAAETGNEAFEKLGLSQETIAGMSQEELFSATITALQNVKSETERTYLASQLLGGSATELGALLNTTAEETEAMRQRVHELGGVMSDEAVKAAAAYQDSLQDMQTAANGTIRGLLTTFLPSVTTIMDGLTEIFSGNSQNGIGLITQGLASFVDNISSTIPLVLEMGGQILTSLSGAIISNLPMLIEAGIQTLETLAQGIMEQLPALTEAAVQILTMFGKFVIANLPLLVDVALQLIIALANGLADSLPELIPAIVEAVVLIGKTLIDNIPLLMDAAWQIIVGIAEGLMAAFPELAAFWEALKAGFAEAWEGVKSVWNAVSAYFQTIWDGIKGIFSVVKSVLTGDFSGAWEGIKGVWNAVIAYYQNIWNGIKSIFSVVDSVLGGFFSKAWDSIKSVWSAVTGFFTDKLNAIQNVFGQKIADAKIWGKDLIQNFLDGITEKWNALKDKVSSVAQTVKDFLGFSKPKKGPLSNFDTYAPDMMELYSQGISKNVDIVQRTLDKCLAFDFTAPGLSFAGAGAGTVSGFASTIGGGLRLESASGDGNVSNLDTGSAAGSSFNQVINISAVAQTPSEVARQTRNATRQMLAKVR